jgi:hypothetical protein
MGVMAASVALDTTIALPPPAMAARRISLMIGL